MENQINIGDQNAQQIGQSPISQPTQIPEKTKINYVVIGLVVLICFVLFAFGGYYLGKQSSNSQRYANNKQGQLTPTGVSETNSPTSTVLISPSPTSIDQIEGWSNFESNPKGISLKYPPALIACGDRQGETTQRTYILVQTTVPCDSSGASENIFLIADQSLIIKSGEDQLYNYLKGMGVGQTKQGMTEGENMAGGTYARIADTKVGGFTAQNYKSDSNPDKKDNRSVFYSYIFGSNDKVYFLSQRYLNSYPNQYNVDFSKTFKDILSTVKFAN